MIDAFSHIRGLPRPFDTARAERALLALAEGADGLLPPPAARAALEAAFGNSPYLARLALRERPFLRRVVEEGPASALVRIERDAVCAHEASSIGEAMAVLRQAKRQAALAIALADIGGLYTVGDVMVALTRFADACVGGALRFILKETAATADFPGDDPAMIERQTGLVVLAMGKYGAFELNYSSDIDLVVFYEAEKFPFRKKDDPRAAAVDIVKALVKLLSETTVDGYVFRTDLRLRPDAGATQIAISTEAAEDYYEGMGQNWERAAMIKARACAGDPASGAAFLKAVEPFIWRRSLDYAAIEDIHSIKRQIHAHEGHGEIAVAGHNIKLGRGGIREIEFFAQTQQLILGGRAPELRKPGTLDAIEALRARGLVSDGAARDLTGAYRFLRMLEHRLQMIEDEQTHTLPKRQHELDHVACFAGFEDAVAFSAALRKCLETVQGHYARLFERAVPLSSAKGSLVFTGVEDDPETIQTLSGMGYADPGHVAGAIRGWHHGRIRATRSARARELLTKLMPALLDALAATADPDAAFAQFDRFLTRLPAGVQLFSLFLANPHLLKLVAEITGSAPRLADHLARSPSMLDVLLDPGFLAELPSRKRLMQLFSEQLAAAPDYEGALDAARRFAKEQIFRVGVQVIEGAARPEDAGPAFAAIAETVTEGLLGAVTDELGATAGGVEGGEFAVVAMGKLGGREMTAGSDLDLIFVYDAPKHVENSDGPKPLAVSTYYARLSQRLIAALTTPTAQGGLYEVDMRLRPTGNKGPVAVSLESFIRYHQSEAWTWERLALTRARVIVAPDKLRAKIEETLRATLSRPSDRPTLLADAREMRAKLRAQFPGRNRWDLKFAPGGLVDIEFIVQALQLCEAQRAPDVLDVNTIAAIETLSDAGALETEEAELLAEASRLQLSLAQVLRITLDGPLDPQTATPGLKSLLVRVTDLSSFEAVEDRLAELQSGVGVVYTRILGH